MPISLLCSSCQQPLKVPDELAGKNCSCPYCKTIMRVPTPQINDTPTIKGSEERVSGRSRQTKSRPHRSASIKFASDGSNVSLLKSAIIGISAAVIVFLLLLPLQQMGYRLGTMFWDSVGINFPTTLLMFWSFAILLLKQRKLSNQKNAFIMDVLPATVSEEITLESLDGLWNISTTYRVTAVRPCWSIE